MTYRMYIIIQLAILVFMIPAVCLNCYVLYLRWCDHAPSRPVLQFDVGKGIDLTYDKAANMITARISDPNWRDTWPGVVVPQTAEPPKTWKDVQVLWSNRGDSPHP